eukprot:1150220-Amphidinium_carterae.3
MEVCTIGGPLSGQWKWHGGVLGGDGAIDEKSQSNASRLSTRVMSEIQDNSQFQHLSGALQSRCTEHFSSHNHQVPL